MNTELDSDTSSEVQWPISSDLTCEEIADKVRELCCEMVRRTAAFKEEQLSIATRLWPDLIKALTAKGKRVGLNGYASPVWPEWSKEPVVALDGHYGNKPKTRAEAELIVRAKGDGSWATMGELWLWLHDAGPIMERGMKTFGYLPKTK